MSPEPGEGLLPVQKTLLLADATRRLQSPIDPVQFACDWNPSFHETKGAFS